MEFANYIARLISAIYATKLLLLCRVSSVVTSALFESVLLSGTYLEVYDTQHKVTMPGKCAVLCAGRLYQPPGCNAFTHNPSDKTCQFYRLGPTCDSHSTLTVFKFNMRGEFYTVQIQNDLFSIYVSPGKMTYLDAKTHCDQLGGYLLQFNSQQEHTAVKSVVSGIKGEVWVGANELRTTRDRKPGVMKSPQSKCALLNTLFMVTHVGTCTVAFDFLCERD